MRHPAVIRPADHAEWRSDKMGKSTIYESERLLVGLNGFEPGQAHALHAHAGMDKVYQVIEGEGVFLLETDDPAALRAFLVPSFGLMHWDVRAATEGDWEQELAAARAGS